MGITNKRVAVFGEALVDVYPERIVPGGAPFNVARHLAAFGVPVLLITRIGRDAHAAHLRREIDRFALNAAGVQVDARRPTGVVQVHETPQGHRFEIPAGQAFDAIDAEDAVELLKESGNIDLVCYGSLAQRGAGSRAALAAVLGACPQAVRYLDLNLRPHGPPGTQWRTLLRDATILKLNDEELCTLADTVGCPRPACDPPDVAAIGRAVQGIFRAAAALGLVIVTLGAHGALAWRRGSERPVTGPATAQPLLVDTVGAGDAFSSVMILGRIAGWPLETALARAGAFAAAVCGIRGAAPDDLHAYRAWIDRWSLPAGRGRGAAHAGRDRNDRNDDSDGNDGTLAMETT